MALLLIEGFESFGPAGGDSPADRDHRPEVQLHGLREFDGDRRRPQRSCSPGQQQQQHVVGQLWLYHESDVDRGRGREVQCVARGYVLFSWCVGRLHPGDESSHPEQRSSGGGILAEYRNDDELRLYTGDLVLHRTQGLLSSDSRHGGRAY